MQQTNQYKLNLIETSDRFSPDPLNENAEKVEALLAAEAQARSDADAAETQARTAADAAEAQIRANAVAAEIQNRTAAVAAEAKTRADADAAEASARKSADDTEAQTRAAADAAEAKARKSADTAEANTRAAADTALDSRVKVLEAHKLAVGSYRGNNASWHTINLGFTPKVVYVQSASSRCTAYALAVTGTNGDILKIITNGFQVNDTANNDVYTYNYLAIL